MEVRLALVKLSPASLSEPRQCEAEPDLQPCAIDPNLAVGEPIAVAGEPLVLAGLDGLLDLDDGLLESQEDVLEILSLSCGHQL